MEEGHLALPSAQAPLSGVKGFAYPGQLFEQLSKSCPRLFHLMGIS